MFPVGGAAYATPPSVTVWPVATTRPPLHVTAPAVVNVEERVVAPVTVREASVDAPADRVEERVVAPVTI